MNLPNPTLPVATLVACAMALTAAGAVALTPRAVVDGPAPQLGQTVPAQFNGWHLLPSSNTLTSVSDGTEGAGDALYDQTVLRTYVNEQGQTVMLALAWGRHQRQDVKVHRPEVCYPAQGFALRAQPVDGLLQLPAHAAPIPVRSLLTQQGNQFETVRYWIRVGNRYGGDGLGTRLYLLQEGFQGRVPDGILVRASQRLPAGQDPKTSYAVLDQFLRDLTAAVPAPTRAMLVQ